MDFTDQDALDAIARLMNGNEWDSDLVLSIADIVHHTGRPLNGAAAQKARPFPNATVNGIDVRTY